MATNKKYFGVQKYIHKSDKYKYVYLIYVNGVEKWRGDLCKLGGGTKLFDKERDAALYIDKQMLELGRKPVNILVLKV